MMGEIKWPLTGGVDLNGESGGVLLLGGNVKVELGLGHQGPHKGGLAEARSPHHHHVEREHPAHAPLHGLGILALIIPQERKKENQEVNE